MLSLASQRGRMVQKLSYIFVLLLIAFTAQAQEGDPIIPEERPVILENEMDSANARPVIGLAKDQLSEVKFAARQSEAKFNTAFIPREENSSELQPKTESKKLSYNFLYYLFYKFRKVDNVDE